MFSCCLIEREPLSDDPQDSLWAAHVCCIPLSSLLSPALTNTNSILHGFTAADRRTFIMQAAKTGHIIAAHMSVSCVIIHPTVGKFEYCSIYLQYLHTDIFLLYTSYRQECSVWVLVVNTPFNPSDQSKRSHYLVTSHVWKLWNVCQFCQTNDLHGWLLISLCTSWSLFTWSQEDACIKSSVIRVFRNNYMNEHCSQATDLNEWCVKSHSLPRVTGWSFNRLVLPPRGHLLT